MGIRIREAGTIVYVAGKMTPMVVVEPDQMRDSDDRTKTRQIKLRPENDPDAKGTWFRSDIVTGG